MKVARKGRRHPPLTREWLLPLPLAHARDISLKCHMALVALRGEHGSEALLMRLRTSVYLVFLALDDAVSPDATIALCVDAERVLDASAARAAQGGAWTLHAHECAVLERVLAANDACVATLTRHRLAELWRHVCTFASAEQPGLVAQAATKMREPAILH
ncbi:hypothetical protein SB394_19015 [Burkholderia sp. BCCIQ04A]|uniref:Fis family transcriptional regulator n=1 Tax=Burkholderia anthinoferrum TaxID=3090833 RepID=A0ABU5WNI6_9BURK|nr:MULTISPECIES: hypothetical protein [Burkholderia]MEB2504717.1 hypothetical protein [Burkholderia anthinoferrum]MEB2531262.1 hypothetical protein [Burkholderia anthinoferrum]MEB2560806.1 hypothetical protein [Burkholderia anthinoferrum]MEB2580529.1 hypothetical protein [Burkholderia anthinoferrum]KVN54465.1 hypothetical protein WT13_25870 [Burkholderia anthina]